MKKLLFLVAIVAISRVGYSQQTTTPSQAPTVAVIEWESQNFDFGKIKQGVPVTHEFKFTNKGNVPLVITNAQASCGCTTPDWTKTPIAPGANGFVKATFNAGAIGPFNKSVTVMANVQNGSSILMFKGEVQTPAVQ